MYVYMYVQNNAVYSIQFYTCIIIMHVTIMWLKEGSLILCNCMFNLLLLTSYTYNNTES